MKKLFVIFLAATSYAACNNAADTNAATSDTSTVTTDSEPIVDTLPADSTASLDSAIRK